MDVLDIFYKEIIEEASTGCIISGFTYNVLFDTYIEEEYRTVSRGLDGVITPLLIINNKQIFNELLLEYVSKCLDFYKNSPYLKEVANVFLEERENGRIEKNIMILLWSNATFEDFANPIEFLKRRIKFLDSTLESSSDFGYVDILSGNLEVCIEKDEIYNETPFKLVASIRNNESKFEFPLVKFGIDGDTVYIYAIQNNFKGNDSYSKKINRLLYKVNDGFNEENDLPEIYGIDNLKDISVSFLAVLNIALMYFKNLGIKQVVASSILLTRWNAKSIAISKRYKETQNEKYLELVSDQERIQHNLTEKFLRLFLRLKVHYEDLVITSYPFEYDSSLHLDISKLNMSNNKLLNSINDVINTDDRKL